MRKINYPLIISDFDGTLLRSDGTIAPETKLAIDGYIAAGGKFGICTGRMTGSILPRAKELGLKGLVASYQGSVVSDIESGALLVDGFIPFDGAVKICKVFEEMGLHTHVYTLDKFYVNMDDEALSMYERVCSVKGDVVLSEPLSALVAREKLKVRKAAVAAAVFLPTRPMVEPADKKRIFSAVEKALGEEFYVTYSAASLVEITSKTFNKGSAVRFMADYYHVPVERTVAVGDSLNDLPMLEAAGCPYIMDNAAPELRAKFPNHCRRVEDVLRTL